MSKNRISIPKQTSEQGSTQLPKKEDEGNKEKKNHTLFSSNVSKRRSYQKKIEENSPKAEENPKPTTTTSYFESRRKRITETQPKVPEKKETQPETQNQKATTSYIPRSRRQITTEVKTETKNEIKEITKSQPIKEPPKEKENAPAKTQISYSRRKYITQNDKEKKEETSPNRNINNYSSDDQIEKIIFIQRWWKDIFNNLKNPKVLKSTSVDGNSKNFTNKSLRISEYMEETDSPSNIKKAQKITESYQPTGKSKYYIETKKIEVYKRQNKPNIRQENILHANTDINITNSNLLNIPLNEIKSYMKDVWNEENSCSTVESLCCFGEEIPNQMNISRNEIIDEYEAEIQELKNIIIQKDQEINNLINDLTSSQHILRTKNDFGNYSPEFEEDAHEIQIISTKLPWNNVIQPYPVNELFIASYRKNIPLFMQEVESLMVLGDMPGNVNVNISSEHSRESESERWSNRLLRQQINGLEIITDERRVLEIQKVNELDITAVVLRPMNICQHLETLCVYGTERDKERDKEDSFNREPCRIQELEGLEILVSPKLPYEKEPLVTQKINNLQIETFQKNQMIQELDGLEVIKASRDSTIENNLLYPEAVNEVAIYGNRQKDSSNRCIELRDSMEMVALPSTDLYVDFVDNFEINRDYDMLLVKPTWNSLIIQGSGLNLLAIPRDMRLENQEVDDFEIRGLEKPELSVEYMENFTFDKAYTFEGLKGKVPLPKIEQKQQQQQQIITQGQIILRDFNEVNCAENVDNLNLSKAYSAKILIPLFDDLEMESFKINLGPSYARGSQQIIIEEQKIQKPKETKEAKETKETNILLNSFDSKKLKKSQGESFVIENTEFNISRTPLDWNNVNLPIKTTKLMIKSSIIPLVQPQQQQQIISSTVSNKNWVNLIQPVKTTKLFVKPTMSRSSNVSKQQGDIRSSNRDSEQPKSTDYIQEGFAINLIADNEKGYNNIIIPAIELFIEGQENKNKLTGQNENLRNQQQQKQVTTTTVTTRIDWKRSARPMKNKELTIRGVPKKQEIKQIKPQLRLYRGDRITIIGKKIGGGKNIINDYNKKVSISNTNVNNNQIKIKDWNISNDLTKENDLKLLGRRKKRIIYAQEAIKAINFFGKKKQNWNATNKAQRNTKFNVGGFKRQWKLDVGNGANVFIRTSTSTLDDETLINDDYNCNEFHEPMMKRGVKAFIYRVKTEEEKESISSEYDALTNVKIQTQYKYHAQSQIQNIKERRSSGQAQANVYVNVKGNISKSNSSNNEYIIDENENSNINGKYKAKIVDSNAYQKRVKTTQIQQSQPQMQIKTQQQQQYEIGYNPNVAKTNLIIPEAGTTIISQYATTQVVNNQGNNLYNKNNNDNNNNNVQNISNTHYEENILNNQNIQGMGIETNSPGVPVSVKNYTQFDNSNNNSNEYNYESNAINNNNNNYQFGFNIEEHSGVNQGNDLQFNESGNNLRHVGNGQIITTQYISSQGNNQGIIENVQNLLNISPYITNIDNTNGNAIRQQIVIHPSQANEEMIQKILSENNDDSRNGSGSGNVVNYPNVRQITKTNSGLDIFKKKSKKDKKTEAIREYNFQG